MSPSFSSFKPPLLPLHYQAEFCCDSCKQGMNNLTFTVTGLAILRQAGFFHFCDFDFSLLCPFWLLTAESLFTKTLSTVYCGPTL